MAAQKIVHQSQATGWVLGLALIALLALPMAGQAERGSAFGSSGGSSSRSASSGDATVSRSPQQSTGSTYNRQPLPQSRQRSETRVIRYNSQSDGIDRRDSVSGSSRSRTGDPVSRGEVYNRNPRASGGLYDSDDDGDRYNRRVLRPGSTPTPYSKRVYIEEDRYQRRHPVQRPTPTPGHYRDDDYYRYPQSRFDYQQQFLHHYNRYRDYHENYRGTQFSTRSYFEDLHRVHSDLFDGRYHIYQPRYSYIEEHRYYRHLGPVASNHVYYAPHRYQSGYYYYHSGRDSHASYRRYSCSPYRYQSYVSYPWYSTYYYSTSNYWRHAAAYAPGFAWGFHYGDDNDGLSFSFGFGSGVQYGSASHYYSWYPYGGYQRISVHESYPDGYTEYVAVAVD